MTPAERLILLSLRELLDSSPFSEHKTRGEKELTAEIDAALGAAPEKRRGRKRTPRAGRGTAFDPSEVQKVEG
jgi:hypothetical protein